MLFVRWVIRWRQIVDQSAILSCFCSHNVWGLLAQSGDDGERQQGHKNHPCRDLIGWAAAVAAYGGAAEKWAVKLVVVHSVLVGWFTFCED
jgi:hypothetical protein